MVGGANRVAAPLLTRTDYSTDPDSDLQEEGKFSEYSLTQRGRPRASTHPVTHVLRRSRISVRFASGFRG